MNKCKGCNREIKWLKTTAGKKMPVDPQEVTIVTKAGSTYRGFIPHWATCPKAEQFKSKPTEGIKTMQWQCPKCGEYHLKAHSCPACGTSYGKEK